MQKAFSKVVDLLYLAKQNEVEIVLNDGRLQLKVAENKSIDKELLAEIRNNKQLIIDFLTNENWKSKKVTKNYNKVSKVETKDSNPIPLSFGQERLWFVHQLEGSIQYHADVVLRLKGKLDIDALQFALQQVIDRHEVLRTVYYEENGAPYQRIKKPGDWKLPISNGSGYNQDVQKLRAFVESLVRAPFDLAKDNMVRANLIELADDEHLLVVTLHHIASDAWSMSIIIKEVVELYSAYAEGREPVLTPLKLQYSDYALWQRNYLQPEVLDAKIAYWKKKLGGVAPLQMPTDYTRPSIRTTAGGSATLRIEKNLSEQLKALSQQNQTSLYMILLTGFKILLQRYTGQQDISIGTSIANRPDKDLEELIGFFVNTLALRTEVDDSDTFNEVLQKVKATTTEAYDHQEVPFEKVVDAVVEERDASRTPLFQAMLVLQNASEAPAFRLGEVQLTRESFSTNTSKFDFTFFMQDTPHGLYGLVEYRSDLFFPCTITRLTAHYQHLLRSIVSNPDQKVSELNILGEEEVRELQTFNRDQVEYPKEKTVVSLFEEQAARTPDAPAVVFEGVVLSYQELNERSNQLAHYLRHRGVKEDQLVPMCIERSAGMMVAMFGILKAGAGYVPIDTDFPADRISYMLEDTAATIVVSSKASRAKLTQGNAEVIEIDGGATDNQATENPTTSLQPHHLAYVIYTSGSTGQPKGVMIEHRNLVDYVWGLNQKTQIGECRSYALVSTIATDLGNTVIYSSLLLGGALHIFFKESVSNIEYLHEYFADNRIDCLKIVPSHFKALSNEGALLLPRKLLVFGGEALQAEVIEDIRAEATSTCRIVNHYGPTETTIGKLLHVVDRNTTYSNTVPIGKPFSNTRVYVLSKQLQLCPIGVPGQLYIAGDGVARGYLNNADLTAARFIKDPFDKEGQSVMYATGDQVKYLDKGEIEFIGRIDNQVKIRGYRVEPGEIESMLQQCRGVSQGVVVAGKDKQGNNRLTGYVVPQGVFDREGIISQLKEKLPEYMIPAMLVELESLPLTPNGKVDRKALPDPEAGEVLGEQYVAPRNEAEQKLADIWQDVLEVDQVGVHDDFFELGGHSLLAVRLISAIRKAFKVEMPISHVFDYPTVALLAGQLESQSTNVLPPIQVVQPRPEHIPLSFSQERLWFIDKLEGSVQYHVPAVLGLKGRLNKEALEFALKTIVNRHEVLRTVFIEQDGQARQQVKDNDQWQLSQKDGREYKDDRAALQQHIQELISEPFDLSKDDMLRAELIMISAEEHVLVVTLHHIASDGWSRSILVREVAELYAAFEDNRPVQLAPLPVQYADYALWQRQYLQGEVLDTKLQYWKDKLQDTEPLQLPTDYTRPAVQTTRGASASFRIEKELATALNELSQQQGSTLFMTLLAVFKVLLYRYTGQKDICVGTPIAGRQQQELEGLIGFFLNTLALRSHLDGQQSFTDFLKEVRATTMEAYEHQEVPFEKVVDAVVKERDLSRTPLFQVMFILQNTPEVQQLKLGELELSAHASAHETAKFDIVLSVTETVTGLVASIEYNTDLYSRGTIDRMIHHYKELIASVVKMPQQKVGSLTMLSKAEEHEILVNFNDTAADYPKDKTIVELFEEQAAKTPDSVAVVFEEQQLTYKDLNERANRLAHYLKSKGVKQEMLVPICAERGVHIITGILAILKAGGAYVPLDADYPAERIKYMLEDTAAKFVITSQGKKEKLLSVENVEILVIDESTEAINGQSTKNLQSVLQPNALAYVIYTSGSMGMPKGVLVEHSNVVSLVKNVGYINFNDNNILLATGSPSFDATTFEYWGMLLNGGQLVLSSEKKLMDPYLLTDEIKTRMVNTMWFTSSWFNILVDNNISLFKNLKTILVGGEKLSEQHVAKIRKTYPSLQIINGYGPTENTTFSLTYNIVETDIKGPISIGRALSNRTAFVVDENGNLTPVGVTGEIYVGGAGLSRGYLNREQLTEEKFVKVSFRKNESLRLYKTGDLGRWNQKGFIEYQGRVDEQVKIRGYRIEPGEIETVLSQCELIKQVVVVASGEREYNKQLIGYIVPNGRYDKDGILNFLRSKIPNYMIPAVWVVLDELPLNKNGKIDKSALPNVESEMLSATEYIEPTTSVQKELCNIWQTVLKIEKISITDNFFELGGDSIIAIQVVSQIKRLGYEIEARDLFTRQTVEGLSNILEERLTESKDKSALLPDYSNRKMTRKAVEYDFKYLIPVKVAGNKLPLYIVSGGGGTAFKFKKMVDFLDPQQSVYGLQQPTNRKDLEAFPDTIESIAAAYISEILLQNPNGPYAISGHCAGGIIAYEMAKQLELMGRKVVFLAMFDTIAPITTNENVKSEGSLKSFTAQLKRSFFKAYLKVDFETFLFRKHTRHAFAYKMNSLRYLVKRAANSDNDDEDIYGLYKRLEESFRTAQKKYKAMPYNGNILIYYAKYHYRFLDVSKNVRYRKFYLTDSIKNSWKQYAKSIEIYEVEGEHSTMFDPKVGGRELAALLQQHLNRSSAGI